MNQFDRSGIDLVGWVTLLPRRGRPRVMRRAIRLSSRWYSQTARPVHWRRHVTRSWCDRAERMASGGPRPDSRHPHREEHQMLAENAVLSVGFIGLGHMGAGMAGRLVDAGHHVAVYNRTASKAQPLVDRGAQLVSRIAEACRGSVVITMLADDAAVEAVVFG